MKKRRELRDELNAFDPKELGIAGDRERIEERVTDVWRGASLRTLLQDFRHAARLLRRTPGVTVVVVLSLALGIGANAAIFSLLDAVLLRTLPVPQPQQLSLLGASDGLHPDLNLFSYPVVQQFEQRAAGVPLGAYNSTTPVPMDNGTGPTAPVDLELVSGGYFPTLELTPQRGRWINDDDNRAMGVSQVAVISDAFWHRQFGGAADVLGQTVSLRGHPLAIVGIAPPGCSGLDPAQPAEVWAPLMLQAELKVHGNLSNDNGDESKPWPGQEQMMWLSVVARVSDGQTPARLAAALTPILHASLLRLQASPTMHVVARAGDRGSDGLRRQYASPLIALFILVGLLLAIAVANVAMLLLARMVTRRREIAIRLALGISRGRLVAQLVVEGLLLALLSGAAAALAAYWGSRLLPHLAASASGAAPFTASLDARVWLLLAGLSLGIGLIVGLLPVRQARRLDLTHCLKADDRTAFGGARAQGRWLVAAQVALALVLVAGAGLFSRNLASMFHNDLGFDRVHTLTVRLSVADSALTPDQWTALEPQLEQRVAAVPGVLSAALADSGIEAGSNSTSGISLYGHADPPGGLESEEVQVSRGYFKTVGMRLLRGRDFDATDAPHTAQATVVNQAFARRFYPGENPIGHTFGYDAQNAGNFHIVGIVADARFQDPHAATNPIFYRLLSQSGNAPGVIEVRTASDPAPLLNAVQAAIRGVDSRLRVRDARTVEWYVDRFLVRDQLVAKLSAGFGLLALALACLGLYGVITYSVNSRALEFGLRMALGSARAGVLRLVLGEAALTVG
ncbi:MAG TPA: ADOP family duplicated permease, partial [Terriglobales bacterium]